MFRARISIFTLIFVSIGFIVKIIPTLKDKPIVLEVFGSKISQNAVVAYITAFLIGILFLLETAYYRRFLGIITCLNQIEWQSKLCSSEADKSSFFRQYNRKHHEYSIFYMVACIFLVSYFIYENNDNLLLSFGLGFIPVGLLMFIYYRILAKIFRNFKENIRHSEEEKTSVEKSL